MTTTSVPTGATHPVTPPQASAAPAAASQPNRRSIACPLTVLQAICHMALLAGYGLAVFISLATLLGTGVGLAIIIVGFALLLAFVYLLYGAAFIETARVEGLYRFGLPTLLPRRSPKRGFPGFLHTVWLQFIDGGTWRAIAHLAIGTVLGYVVWSFAMTFVYATTAAFAPLWGGEVRVFGFHFDAPGSAPSPLRSSPWSASQRCTGWRCCTVMSRVIVAPMREAQLAAQAREASYRAEQATAQAYSAASQRADAIRAGSWSAPASSATCTTACSRPWTSVGMTLGLAQNKIDSDPDQAKGLVAEAHTSTKAAITELRQLARGIHASVLDDRGLDAAPRRSPVARTSRCISTCGWRAIRAATSRPRCTSRSRRA